MLLGDASGDWMQVVKTPGNCWWSCVGFRLP